MQAQEARSLALREEKIRYCSQGGQYLSPPSPDEGAPILLTERPPVSRALLQIDFARDFARARASWPGGGEELTEERGEIMQGVERVAASPFLKSIAAISLVARGRLRSSSR